MIRFAGDQKAVDKALRSAGVAQGGNQQALIKIAGNYMMPMPGLRTLPGHIVHPVVNMGDGGRMLGFIFYFHFHPVANGNGIGAGDIIGFKHAFYSGFPGVALLIGDVVPASGRFIYGGDQKKRLIEYSNT